MASALRVLINNASVVEFVRSVQELFCVLVPERRQTRKLGQVELVHQTLIQNNITVGLVRFCSRSFGVGFPKTIRAQLYVATQRYGSKTLETCGFAGIATASKRGRP